jgi:hypothetical protein
MKPAPMMMLMVTGAALMIGNDLSKLAVYGLSLVHVDLPPDLQLVLVDLLTLAAAAAMAFLMPTPMTMQTMRPIVPAVALVAALGAAPFLMAGSGAARQPVEAAAQLPLSDPSKGVSEIDLSNLPVDDTYTIGRETPTNPAGGDDENPTLEPVFGSIAFCSRGNQPARAVERCLNWSASIRQSAR